MMNHQYETSLILFSIQSPLTNNGTMTGIEWIQLGFLDFKTLGSKLIQIIIVDEHLLVDLLHIGKFHFAIFQSTLLFFD